MDFTSLSQFTWAFFLGFKASIKVDKLYHIFTIQRTKDSINNYINIIYLVNNAFTEKEEIYNCFFTKNLSPKDCVEIIVFCSLTNFVVFSTKIWEIFGNSCFSTVHFTNFPKIWKKKNSKFLKSQIYQKRGEKNPLWWRPRGQTLGKGLMNLFHGFNSQVKDQNPETMWHVTCDLCTRLCLEWKISMVFPFALNPWTLMLATKVSQLLTSIIVKTLKLMEGIWISTWKELSHWKGQTMLRQQRSTHTRTQCI